MKIEQGGQAASAVFGLQKESDHQLFDKSIFYRPIFYAVCAQKDTGYALVLAEANADMMPIHLDLIAENIDEDPTAIILMDHTS